MANGFSCVFFAAKNFINGQKDNNVFKDGIACAQTVRSANEVSRGIKTTVSLVEGSPAATSLENGFLYKAAAVAKKFVYPLIILSGAYDTYKSDDKVRTGAKNAGGIAAMWSLETVADKVLNKFCRVSNINKLEGKSKAIVPALYVARGAAFIAASLIGYSLGAKGAVTVVDTVRAKREAKNSDTFENGNKTESVNYIDKLKTA